MSITNIEIQSLRNMRNKQGLILRGCGGDIQDWIDGINQQFHKNGILMDNTSFKDVYVFKDKNSTCILYPFTKDLSLNVGRLSIWRIQTSGQFGGIWLTDFVDNYLGGFIDNNETTISEESKGMVL